MAKEEAGFLVAVQVMEHCPGYELAVHSGLGTHSPSSLKAFFSNLQA